MGKKLQGSDWSHVSETPATQLLRRAGVAFTSHPYAYAPHGGAQHSAEVLGLDPFCVIKTLVMHDQDAKPLLVLMHGNRKVSTKNLARQIGAKSVEPCAPDVASRHSGYLVGGTSPFATRRRMPVYFEESILALPRIVINGGRRGFLVGMDPQVCMQLLDATPVHCALDEGRDVARQEVAKEVGKEVSKEVADQRVEQSHGLMAQAKKAG